MSCYHACDGMLLQAYASETSEKQQHGTACLDRWAGRGVDLQGEQTCLQYDTSSLSISG